MHSTVQSEPSSPEVKLNRNASVDSGFASGNSSTESLPLISFTQAHLRHLNKQLETMEPMGILRVCKVLFPNLFQTTAFGLTGLVTIDMLSKLAALGPPTARENGGKLEIGVCSLLGLDLGDPVVQL